MEKIKVSIISAGMITNKAHIPAYLNRSDCYTVTAVSDLNFEAAKETKERFSLEACYRDAEEMLEKEKPDLVSVCVPNRFHKEYTLLALSKGAHVICEKPLAYKYKDAVEMYDAARKAEKHLVACQSMRFLPERLTAKRLIDEGALGEVYYGEFSRIRQRGVPFWGKFHIKEESGGGAFLDIGVHMIDSLLWLMGNPEVKSVSGTSATRLALSDDYEGGEKESGALGGVDKVRELKKEEFNVEDFASGSVAFRDGARANFKVAWAANLPEASSFTLAGDKAGLSLPNFKFYGRGEAVDKLNSLMPDKQKYENETFPGHFYLADHMAKVLSGKEEIMIKPEETINTAALIDCFYKSAELGREVTLDEIKEL